MLHSFSPSFCFRQPTGLPETVKSSLSRCRASCRVFARGRTEPHNAPESNRTPVTAPPKPLLRCEKRHRSGLPALEIVCTQPTGLPETVKSSLSRCRASCHPPGVSRARSALSISLRFPYSIQRPSIKALQAGQSVGSRSGNAYLISKIGSAIEPPAGTIGRTLMSLSIRHSIRTGSPQASASRSTGSMSAFLSIRSALTPNACPSRA